MSEGTAYYTTKRGGKIKVQSFPHLLPGKVQAAAEKKSLELYPGEQPTYDEPLMGGGVQTFFHDEKSVVGNPEAEAKFAAWQDAERRRTAYINEKMMQFYILEGTVVDMPTDDKWQKRQRFFGVEIPEDETELLYHYITTVLLSDAREVMALVERIMEAAGIDKETLRAAQKTFRGILGEEADTTGGTDRGDTGPEVDGESLVHIPSVPTVSDNGAVEPDTVAMGFSI